MIITVTTNRLDASRAMREIFSDQLPFAVSRAVRQTALDFQEGQREHQRKIFTVRRPTYVDRAVKISQFPTKVEPTAIIRVDPPGDRDEIIARHEEAGIREPGPGHRGKAVPDFGDPTKIVPKRLRPTQLGLVKFGKTKGGREIFRGKQRTIMFQNPDGSGVILQRVGPGRRGTFEGTRRLFVIAAGGVRIRGVLDFHENAERIVGQVWERNMAEAWNRAVETAR